MEGTTLPLYRLGGDGPWLTPIGLGTARFSGGVGAFGRYWGPFDPELAGKLIADTLQSGINWYESSLRYGRGAALRTLGGLSVENAYLALSLRGAVVSGRAAAESATPNRRFRHMQELLGGHPIGLYIAEHPTGRVSFEKLARTAATLKREGIIESVGVGNFSAEQIAKAAAFLSDEGIRLRANRATFNLLDRRIEENEVLAACRQYDVSLIACSPLAQGLLGGGYHREPGMSRRRTGLRRFSRRFSKVALRRCEPLLRVLGDIADERGIGIAEVALNWTTRQFGTRVLALLSVGEAWQVQAAADSMCFRLSAREHQQIDEASKELSRARA